MRTHLLVALLFGIVITIIMGPAVTSCTTTVDGYPGDSTSGLIWQNWVEGHLHTGPELGFSTYSNAPFGENLANPAAITSQLIIVPEWALSRLTSPLCGWNIMIFLGLLGCALSMYGLVWWLTRSAFPAFFAGYAVAFSPYHIYKAGGHIGYVYSFVLILLLWAFLYFCARPSPRRAVLLGLATAAPFYTDGYYVLIAPVMLAAMIVPSIVMAARRYSQKRQWQQLAKSAAVALITAFVLLLPLIAGYATQSKAVNGGLASVRANTKAEVFTYTARWREFFTPPPTHPVFSNFMRDSIGKNLHGSNYSEQTLYVGYSVLILAIFGFISLLRDDRQPKARFIAWVSASVLIVTLAFSMQPYLYIGGIKIPTPPEIVSHFTALWRVYARFFLPFHTALSMLAGIGLYYLARHRKTSVRVGIYAVAVAVVAFEFLVIPPRPTWSYSDSPQVYRWVAAQESISTVAEYPLVSPPVQTAYDYFTYQQVHGKKLLNTALADSPQQSLHTALSDLSDPQTPIALKSLGIDAIIVDPQYGKLPQAGYTTIYSGGGYSVLKPIAAATEPILVPASGFSDPMLNPDGTSSRYMGPAGIMTIVNRTTSRNARVSFSARAAGPDVEVTIKQRNVVLWQGEIGNEAISFVADSSSPLYLSTNSKAPVTLVATQFQATSD